VRSITPSIGEGVRERSAWGIAMSKRQTGATLGIRYGILPTMTEHFDIIVVGGGHAGTEAALIAARMGVPTLLVTGLRSAIARMPCNPSIGGLAKSHLVCELDALGGEMGFNADLTSLQEKTLNTSRGPAVQATRAQCDKSHYTRRMQRVIELQSNLSILEDVVVDITTSRASESRQTILGIQTAAHGFISASKVILTTGTTLRGRIFIGHESIPSAGDGRPPVDLLSQSLNRLGFQLIRLKTGTPPRIKASTVDFSKTIEQPAEIDPHFFSLRTRYIVSTWKQPTVCPYSHHVSTWKQPPASPTTSEYDNFVVLQRKHEVGDVSTWKHITEEDSNTTDVSTWEQHLAPWNLNTPLMSCWASQTTEVSHKIIEDHLKDSALYGG